MKTMQLIEAIHQKKIVEFRYEGRTRVVEPHTVGVLTTGRPGLRAYQVGGTQSPGPSLPGGCIRSTRWVDWS